MSAKQWQATIWVGDATAAEPITFYGETLKALRAAATAWLIEHRPPRFCHETRVRTGYVGTRGEQRYEPGWEWKLYDGRILPWHGIEADTGADEAGYTALVARFVASYMFPEKGPEYVDRLVQDDEVQHHRIRTFLRTQDEQRANDYVRRGWRVLASELDSDVNSRTVTFVLVHPEEDAL